MKERARIAKDEPATSETLRTIQPPDEVAAESGEPTSRKILERIARNAPTSCFVDREKWRRSAIGSALKVLVARAGALHGVLGCGKVTQIHNGRTFYEENNQSAEANG